jgi:hypothetical protein
MASRHQHYSSLVEALLRCSDAFVLELDLKSMAACKIKRDMDASNLAHSIQMYGVREIDANGAGFPKAANILLPAC